MKSRGVVYPAAGAGSHSTARHRTIEELTRAHSKGRLKIPPREIHVYSVE